MKVKKVGQVLRVVNSNRKRFPLTLTEYRVFVEWLRHAPGFHPTTIQIGNELNIDRGNVSTALRALAKKEVLWYEGRGKVGQPKYRIHDALALTAGEDTDVSWEDELEALNARTKPV